MLTLGLDIGGTTTDCVAMSDDGEVLSAVTVVADHPTAAAGGAVAKLLDELNLSPKDVFKLAVTGGGHMFIRDSFLGMNVIKVDEITAIGLGGFTLLRLIGLAQEEAFIVNVGTGTAMVSVREGGARIRHCGGTALGGGTLLGLGKLLLKANSISTIERLAEYGNLEMVDLTVGDITGAAVGRIPKEATASHFGKVNDDTKLEDIALGLMNMVGQTIAVIAYFASVADGFKGRITFTGKVVKLKHILQAIERVLDIFEVGFIVPERAEYATAIGAAEYARQLVVKGR